MSLMIISGPRNFISLADGLHDLQKQLKNFRMFFSNATFFVLVWFFPFFSM